MVAEHRYHLPEGATRVRLVYLPDAGSRAALVSRAGKGLILRARS